MIADTSFLIDLLMKKEEAVKKAEKLEKENKGYSITTPTLYELWAGVSRSDADEKDEILDIIESQIIYGLDEESSLAAGKIQRKLLQQGDRIGHIDALIAGITRSNSNKILTGNVTEFDRVENLEVEDYHE